MRTLARAVSLIVLLASVVLVGCQRVDPVEAYVVAVDTELLAFDVALDSALDLDTDEAALVLEDLLAAQERVAALEVPEGAEAFADDAASYMDLVLRMLDEIVLQTCMDCVREYGAQAGAQRGQMDRDRTQPRGGH